MYLILKIIAVIVLYIWAILCFILVSLFLLKINKQSVYMWNSINEIYDIKNARNPIKGKNLFHWLIDREERYTLEKSLF